MAQRESTWQVVWDPTGESPRVLLDYGDVMDDEVARTLSQLTTVLRYDTAAGGIPVGRLNKKRRLTLTRTLGLADPVDAFADLLAGAAGDPWNENALLKIGRYNSTASYVRAALLSTDREVVHDPETGLRERLALRIDSGLAPSGPLLTIIGGWFNPPVEGGGTPSGGITIVIDGEDTGLEPGDIVYVDDVPGLTSGFYPVTSVTTGGGQTTAEIDAPNGNHPRISGTGVVGASTIGYVDMAFDATVHIDGMGDGATYEILTPGGAWVPVTVDPFGRAEISYNDILSRINYGVAGIHVWAGAVNGDVLAITGGTVDNPSPGDNVVNEDGPSGWTVKLRRNGAGEEDTQTITPSWATAKTWQTGGPASHVISGAAVTFDLHGPLGGSSRRDTGVSQPITGGSIQKAL